MSRNRFRVGTFNVYNLISPDRFYYGNRKYKPEIYEKKIRWIGAQLDCMKANVVGFQEVWEEKALSEAIAQSESLQGAKIVVAKEVGNSPSVAIASTLPIVGHQVIEAFPESALLQIEGEELALKKFSRPILCAQIQLRKGLECTVVVAHLKSKRPDLAAGADENDPLENAKGKVRSLIRRAAESVALRSVLLDLLKDRTHPVIAMGDLNDSPGAVTTQLISGEPPWRKLSVARKTAIWDVLMHHVKDIQARKSYEDFY